VGYAEGFKPDEEAGGQVFCPRAIRWAGKCWSNCGRALEAPIRAGDTLRLTGPIFAGFAKLADNPGRLLRTAVCRSVHPIELRFHSTTPR
jgi:hypothetical protein